MSKTHHHEKTGHFLPKHAVQGFKAQSHPPTPHPLAPLTGGQPPTGGAVVPVAPNPPKR